MKSLAPAIAAFTLGGLLLTGFGPVRKNDEAAQEQLFVAEQQLENGDVEGAISTLRGLRLRYQNTPAGHEGTALLGELLLAQEDPEGALTAAEGVLQSPALSSEIEDAAHYVAGMALYSQGHFDEARVNLDEVDLSSLDQAEMEALLRAQADMATVEGDALTQIKTLLRLLPYLSEAEVAQQRVAMDRLILDTLDLQSLSLLAAGLTPGWPQDTILHAQILAALHEDHYDAVIPMAERFLGEYPGHSASADVALLLQRARLQDALVPTRIGVILPLSGRFAAPGEAVKRGLDLALSTLPAPAWAPGGIELVFRDTQGQGTLAAEAIQTLVLQEQVAAIIGPLVSAEAEAAAIAATQMEVPLITLTQKPGIPETGPYVFRNFPTVERQLERLVEHAVSEGYQKVGILYPETRYGTYVADLFWDASLANGIAITAVEAYPADTDDFTPIAMKLTGKYWAEPRRSEYRAMRAELKGDDDPKNDDDDIELPPITDFDALFIADTYKGAALLAPALAYMEMPVGRFKLHDKQTPIALLGGNTWNNPNLGRLGGEYVVGASFVSDYFAGDESEPAQAFSTAYKKAYGRRPETFAAHAFDSVGLLLEALGEEPPTSRLALQGRLESLEGYEGATGEIAFDSLGELDREPHILTLTRKGKIVEFVPKGQSKKTAVPGAAPTQ